MATKPHTYVLGSTPEVYFTATNKNGDGITPIEMRVSIKQPNGVIYTVSGTDAEMLADTTVSGQFYLVYHPESIGWYEYESWVKDGNGREQATTNGFEIIDRVY